MFSCGPEADLGRHGAVGPDAPSLPHGLVGRGRHWDAAPCAWCNNAEPNWKQGGFSEWSRNWSIFSMWKKAVFCGQDQDSGKMEGMLSIVRLSRD